MVKIKSRQSITRSKKKHLDTDEEAEPKVVTEYFVLNQVNVEKAQDKWKVWGTTTETDGEFSFLSVLAFYLIKKIY